MERQKDSKYFKPFQKFKRFKNLAILNNIQQIKYILVQRPQLLLEITRIVDETIDGNTKWMYYPQYIEDKKSESVRHLNPSDHEYIFVGEDRFQNVYQVNILDGRVLKNGQ